MADSTFPDKVLQSTPARILIAALQTVLVSQVLLFTFFLRQHIEVILIKYTIVLLIGLLAGFSARRLLKGHTRALKILTALVSAALSLASLSYLSGGFLGINISFGSRGGPDWGGLIQFGLSALGVLLVVSAFNQRPGSREPETPLPPPSAPRVRSDRGSGIKGWISRVSLSAGANTRRGSSGVQAKIKGGAAGGKPSALQVAAPKPLQKTTRNKAGVRADKSAAPAKLSLAGPPAALQEKKAKPKRKKAKREIRLVGEMEHNCPYCLEPVLDHDPRGVKICSVCKTRHHADCWGITGACQIPHSHK